MAELADAHDSNSCGEIRVGSTPTFGICGPLPEGHPNYTKYPGSNQVDDLGLTSCDGVLGLFFAGQVLRYSRYEAD